MNRDELLEYYQGVQLFVGVVNNFINFDDIDAPLKSYVTSIGNIGVDTSKVSERKAILA